MIFGKCVLLAMTSQVVHISNKFLSYFLEIVLQLPPVYNILPITSITINEIVIMTFT